MVHSNQFIGHPLDDLDEHLSDFLQVVDTIKVNGLLHEVIKLKLFPFSLREKVRHNYKSLKSGSITTWDQLIEEFFDMFYQIKKTVELRGKIINFKKKYSESGFKAWERYEDLLCKCPNHGLALWSQNYAFYSELNGYNMGNVNPVAGATIGKKTYAKAIEIFKLLAKQSKRNSHKPSKAQGRAKINKIVKLETKIYAMMRKLDRKEVRTFFWTKHLPCKLWMKR